MPIFDAGKTEEFLFFVDNFWKTLEETIAISDTG